MKYLRLFEDFDSYDPYELMIIPPNKKAEMIIEEIKKREPNLNLISDLITLGANLDWKNENDSNRTPLYVAAYWGKVEIARMLIDAGADVDVKDNNDDTSLHVAIKYGRVEVVRILIDAGANLNVQNNQGETPVHYAAMNGNPGIARMLIDAGADENILTHEGLRWDELIDYDYYNDYDE
jgi:ankyrin repeat protein